MPSLIVGDSTRYVGEAEVGGYANSVATRNASGSLVFSGLASYIRDRNRVSTGSIVFGGTAGYLYEGVKSLEFFSSGGIAFSGAGAYSKQKSLATSGGFVFNGTASIGKQKSFIASGLLTFIGQGSFKRFTSNASIWNYDLNDASASAASIGNIWEDDVSVSVPTVESSSGIWN